MMGKTAGSLLIWVLTVSSVIGKLDYCSPTYKCGAAENTKCIYKKEEPGASCVDPVRTNLTSAEKRQLLMIHNEIRERVAKGSMPVLINGSESGFFPPSSDMQRVVWDSRLADMALRWAYQCQGDKHDACRKTLDFPEPGQNIVDFNDPGDKIDIGQWEEHFIDFPIGLLAEPQKLTRAGDQFAARMLVGAMSALGCGRVVTGGDGGDRKSHVVCDYSHGGRLAGPLYAVGKPCSRCAGQRGCAPRAAGFEHLCSVPARQYYDYDRYNDDSNENSYELNEGTKKLVIAVTVIFDLLTACCCALGLVMIIAFTVYYVVDKTKKGTVR